MLHDIVFRCIPVSLRNILIKRIQSKLGITFSGLWVLKNEHHIIPRLARFQREMIQYKHISKWDTSLLCKILLYSDLHLLAEWIPPSDYTVLTPSEIVITNYNIISSLNTLGYIERNFQWVIVQGRSSTRFVRVKCATICADKRILQLKLSDRVLLPMVQDTHYWQIYICSHQWNAVRQLGIIRNQYTHRPNEKVSTVELAKVINEMNNALNSLNIPPCQNTRGCICYRRIDHVSIT